MKTVVLGELVTPAKVERAGEAELPVLSMTRSEGLVRQESVFNKSVAGTDRSRYKVVRPHQLVVGIHIDEGALGMSAGDQAGLVSPAYSMWDLSRHAKVDPNYLHSYLRSPRALAYFRSNYRQTAERRGKIPRDRFLSLPVPLPDLDEQKRIAAILDGADAVRAKRRESLALLDELAQSVFLDMFGDPVQNSLNFRTVTLGELGDWRSGGTPPRNRPDYFTGSIPWFSSGELHGMVVSESAESVTPAAIAETSVKRVPKGALMLGMYDTAALKAAIAGVSCACNQAVAFAQLDHNVVESTYVYFAISVGREHFRRLQRGVRQKNLNLSMLRRIVLPLPPKETQARFTRFVRQVSQVKARYEAHLAEVDTLFASFQSRAFRGEL